MHLAEKQLAQALLLQAIEKIPTLANRSSGDILVEQASLSSNGLVGESYPVENVLRSSLKHWMVRILHLRVSWPFSRTVLDARWRQSAVARLPLNKASGFGPR